MRSIFQSLSFAACVLALPAWGQVPSENTPGSAPAEILTPPTPATPAIHGAKVFGVRPGSPFLFTVAATGVRPLAFSADNLPAGLALDSATGQITGTAPKAGNYPVTLHAKNALGETTRRLVIKAGNTLALTPPMGWNSWSCFREAVSDQDVRAEADAMVKSGLADYGWSYINIDDFWERNPTMGKTDPTLAGPERSPGGDILPNARFPGMKALADYIHSLGLKAGLYSSPGPYTCGKCTGSYPHEEQDARQYAAWDFDYLKYDWCSYGRIYKASEGLDGRKKPYRVMGDALAKVNRDIVFSMCQYGNSDVWKWGADVGGNLWRTTSDIRDNWNSMIGNGERQAGLESYAGSGHWNDPDMLVMGSVRFRDQATNVVPKTSHPSHLTPDEQYTQVSLWCLEAAPLLISSDLRQLDAFTLSLLTNDEVLDVDQDSLGQAARVVPSSTDGKTTIQIWARPLEDGSTAVGLINMGPAPATGVVTWSDLHLTGAQRVRDLWRQKNLGSFPERYTATVAPHGVVLVKVTAGK